MTDASAPPDLAQGQRDDIVLPFRTVRSGVMGRLVRLGSSVDTIGKRPMNSGIIPNLIRSCVSTSDTRELSFVTCLP